MSTAGIDLTSLSLPKGESHHGALAINEAFISVQGEGPHAGQRALFLRLAGCNLACSWCDSRHSWDWAGGIPREDEVVYAEPDAVARWLAGQKVPRVVVTGGEPLLQAPALAKTFWLLKERYRTPASSAQQYDVETNGTRPLGQTTHWWDLVVASPKVLPSAGQSAFVSQPDPGVLRHGKTVLKMVVRDEVDLAALDEWVRERGIDWSRVWLMPEGTTSERLTWRTPFVWQAAVERGANVSTRLHVYGTEGRRGT
jgi:organic radical activating enzyme